MQITRITSEALQATIRRLLPSQQGFGEDLQATNVITPIIDLTPTAEGSSVPESLQQALAYGSQTVFSQTNAGDVAIISTAGFYRITGSYSFILNQSNTQRIGFILNDGSTKKLIYSWEKNTGSSFSEYFSDTFDFNVFLRSGDTLEGRTTNSGTLLAGSFRQIADVNGVLTNPSGFTPQ